MTVLFIYTSTERLCTLPLRDTSRLEDMTFLFQNSREVVGQDLKTWDILSTHRMTISFSPLQQMENMHTFLPTDPVEKVVLICIKLHFGETLKSQLLT